jgi:hypothetical protein
MDDLPRRQLRGRTPEELAAVAFEVVDPEYAALNSD